jgi:hypothetical protein
MSEPGVLNGSKQFRQQKLLEKLQRRAEVAERYRRCWTLQRIADDVGVSIFTVSEDIKALLSELGRTAGLHINARIALELDKINLLENEAWESLRLSKLPQRAADARKTAIPINGQIVESTVSSASEVYQPQGDPRFMAIIDKCITRRMKLFGLEGGRGDEDSEKKNTAKTFTDFVAAHIEEQEMRKLKSMKVVKLLSE